MASRTEELTVVFKEKQRRGLIAAAWMAGLTLVEYFVAVWLEGGLVWPFLLPLMAGKAWIIMDYFMHIKQLGGEQH